MSNESEAFVLDFGGIEAPAPPSYMTPGQYLMKVENVELGTNQSGTKHMAVTFVRKSDDAKFTEKFHLEGKQASSTRTLLGRLQYLHEAWTGAKLNKTFTDHEQMATYFNGCLTYKEKAKPIIVGGDYDAENDRVWAKLPFTGFIAEEANFEEMEYEPGSAEYKKVVTIRKTNGTPGTNSTVVNAAGAEVSDLPWA